MSKYTEEFDKKFREIKEKGWIESSRSGDTGIGKTFEDLLGKNEDNKSEPDFEDIEVKVNRKKSSSNTTLFTKSPGKRGTNRKIREEFGVIEGDSAVKKLHTSISSTHFNNHRSGNHFKLEINEASDSLEIHVKESLDSTNTRVVTSWPFSSLNKPVKDKLKNIAHIKGEEKTENEKKYFRYTDVEHIQGITPEKFREGIKNGDIVVEFRLGVHSSGKKKGKPHDYGTAFRMNPNKLPKLRDNDSENENE